MELFGNFLELLNPEQKEALSELLNSASEQVEESAEVETEDQFDWFLSFQMNIKYTLHPALIRRLRHYSTLVDLPSTTGPQHFKDKMRELIQNQFSARGWIFSDIYIFLDWDEWDQDTMDFECFVVITDPKNQDDHPLTDDAFAPPQLEVWNFTRKVKVFSVNDYDNALYMNELLNSENFLLVLNIIRDSTHIRGLGSWKSNVSTGEATALLDELLTKEPGTLVQLKYFPLTETQMIYYKDAFIAKGWQRVI